LRAKGRSRSGRRGTSGTARSGWGSRGASRVGPRDQVERTIRRHALLAGGETVLVAVSGGAGSVALLHSPVELAPAWRLRLHVLHVDHQLRPDSAAAAEFVRALGARLGVPVDVVNVTIDSRGSLEAAARESRYAALEAGAPPPPRPPAPR